MAEKLPIFISAEQLHDVMDNDDIQIVAVDSMPDFEAVHIPGALQVALSDLKASEPPVEGLLPSDDVLAGLFSQAGLRNDAHIVAYDRMGDAPAARLLYTLDAMGHSAFSLLDGGLVAWHEAGYPLELGAPSSGTSDFQVARQPNRIADRGWIESHLTDHQTCFLDVRGAAEYAGDDVRSARGGHIPGAINLDWTQFKDASKRLKPRQELEALLSTHGIEPEKDIVNYCQSHMRSSYSYLVLKALGYNHVRGYPGAWSDWGNTPETPIEQGSAQT